MDEDRRGYGYYEDDDRYRDTEPHESYEHEHHEHHERHEKRSKSNKGLIAAVVILIFVVAGLVAFIVYDKLNSDNQVKCATVASEEPKAEDSKEKEEEKEEDTAKTEKPAEVDLTKSLNTNGDSYEFFNEKDGLPKVDFEVSDDKRSVTVKYDWDSAEFSGISGASTGTKEYEVTGFTKDVKSAFNGIAGQDVTGEFFFFLMEDGTVEYVNVFKTSETTGTTSVNFSSKNTFKTEGSISSKVKDIVGFRNTQVQEDEGSGYATTIAVKEDGSFYNLSVYLNN